MNHFARELANCVNSASRRQSRDFNNRRFRSPLSLSLITDASRLVDVVIIIVSGLIIHYAYVTPPTASMRPEYITAFITCGTVVSIIFPAMGAYSVETVLEPRLCIERTLTAWLFSFIALLIIAFLFKVSTEFSRFWALSWFFSVALLLTTVHHIFNWGLRHLVERGHFAARTVVVGAGDIGARFVAHLQSKNNHSTRVVGFVDDRKDRVPNSICGLPLIGNTTFLMELIRRDEVDQVFIALPWSAESRVKALIEKLAITPVRIRLMPDLIGYQLKTCSITQVAGLPLLDVCDRPISGWSHVVKAMEDRIVAFLALVFLAPWIAAVALIVKLESRGPVLFRQPRLGFNNQLIEVWKFRTMYVDVADLDGERQTVRNDSRVTRLGALLRRTSIDELPQLFNVLTGAMSIVGPRPHALRTKAEGQLFEDVVERYAARHRVKPGVTGWAQVNGWRGETDTIEKIQKRVEFDFYYIDNWSISLDIEILIRTLFVIFRQQNAY